MEIGKIVNSEQLFDLELLHPATEKPLGITMLIRSASSDEAKEIARKHTDHNIIRAQKRKMVKGGTLENQEVEKAASYIDSWDWGKNTWNGKVPEFNKETITKILQAEDWIFEQVVEAATSVSNFT